MRFSEDAARRAGVSPAQYQLMLFVKSYRADFPSIVDLAERMQVNHHSAVELIDRSSRAGLLARLKDRNDARRVRVRLTQKGARILERLVREHYGRIAELHRSAQAALRFDAR